MRRLLFISLLVLATSLVAVPTALAATAPAPTITRVTPMRVSVGNLLTIRGTHFKAQRLRNTVIFRGPDGLTAFAKPRRATTTKLVVRVPAAAARLLRVSGSRQRPTRLKLRVLSGKFSKFTSRRLSPVVTGVGDGDGVVAAALRSSATAPRTTTATSWRPTWSSPSGRTLPRRHRQRPAV